MAEDRNDKVWWAVGVFAVVILGFIIWWSTSKPMEPATNGIATTTSELSGAGQVTIENSSSSVLTIVANVPNGGTFYDLLSRTVGTSSISGKGPYTIFVATDGAFSRLPPGTISAMSSAQLKRTIQYHIIVGKRLDVDALNSGQVQALSTDTLNFQVDVKKGAVYVNSGYVLHAYKATNGIVYVINSVLLPPKLTP